MADDLKAVRIGDDPPEQVSQTEAVPVRSEATTAVRKDVGERGSNWAGSERDRPRSKLEADSHEPEFLSVLERSRSAVWPLVLALVVGIAIGFAAGYGTGSQRQSPATAAAAPPGREFTEGAVAESAKASPAAPAPDADKTAAKAAGAGQSARAASRQSVPESGRLLVRSTPANASVSDRRPRRRSNAGDGPRSRVRRASRARDSRRLRDARPTRGRHRRRVRRSRSTFELVRDEAPAPEPRRAPVAAASPPAVSAPSGPGPLRVESRPAGASVYLDGRLVGVTPLSLPAVPAGEHTIRLELDGYQSWTSSVRVVATEANRVTASLER